MRESLEKSKPAFIVSLLTWTRRMTGPQDEEYPEFFPFWKFPVPCGKDRGQVRTYIYTHQIREKLPSAWKDPLSVRISAPTAKCCTHFVFYQLHDTLQCVCVCTCDILGLSGLSFSEIEWCYFQNRGRHSYFSEAVARGKVWTVPWRREGVAPWQMDTRLKGSPGQVRQCLAELVRPPGLASPSPCFWCPPSFSWFLILRTQLWPVLDHWLKPLLWTSLDLLICAIVLIC